MRDKRRPVPLTVGEPAPWFECRTRARARFHFDTVAGRYIVLSFLGSASDPRSAALLEAVHANRARFDDERCAFFGVTLDPADEQRPLAADARPGIRFFFDFERKVSALYGVATDAGGCRLISYVLDPALRVCAVLSNRGEGHAAALLSVLDSLPSSEPPALAPSHAPVLIAPRIFEPELCRELMAHYDARGGSDMGFVRDVNGRTTVIVDHSHKRRGDLILEDEPLRHACSQRIRDRLVPEIHKAFQVRPLYLERYLVSCYDGETGGHFRAHRDNTTRGTAHRQFAVSLFLNSGEYEGGFLRFPEFGSALYGAPVGGAVVFSCSLLHEAMPVTRGRRMMFLPFLYDEASQRVREENSRYLDPTLFPT
jgi:peroxiredoxin/predicted 2-oxoglutarate/Fe(II)-dependent dioxygenase YbiX